MCVIAMGPFREKSHCSTLRLRPSIMHASLAVSCRAVGARIPPKKEICVASVRNGVLIFP